MTKHNTNKSHLPCRRRDSNP